MNIRAKLICLALLATAAVVKAQNETVIPVVEDSEVGAPVRITGQVTAKDQPSDVLRYTFESDIDMTNVSSKAILLMIVKLDIISPLPISLNYSEEDDYFFESKVLQPASIAKLQRVLGRSGQPKGTPQSFVTERSARATVAFVQFLDGSTWGDAAAAERLLRARPLSLKQLQILREDYRKRSKEEFLRMLLQPTLLQPIIALQDLYREKQDLTLVVTRLNEMIESARAHGDSAKLTISLR